MITIYDTGTTYEIDEAQIYNPWPEPEAKEKTNEKDATDSD